MDSKQESKRMDAPSVLQPAADIPVAETVDVVVVGATTGAMASAIAAAENGARVLLLSPHYYAGTDLAATNRYWLEPGEIPETNLEKTLFVARETRGGYTFLTPGPYKKACEDVLLQVGVRFLYNTCCTGVLRDDRSKVAGIVIANKAGSQAVLAGTVIDATPTAAVAQMAGAQITGWPEAPVTVSRTLFRASGGHEVGDYREFTMDIAMADGSWPERQRADVRLRTACDRGDAAWSAHAPHWIEPHAIVAEREPPSAPVSPEEMNLGCCRPRGVDHVYVLSAMCAVPRRDAQRLVRPLALMRLGRRIGLSAAEDTRRREAIGPARVQTDTSPERPASTVEAREALAGRRPCRDYARVPRPEGGIPVWAEYDRERGFSA